MKQVMKPLIVVLVVALLGANYQYRLKTLKTKLAKAEGENEQLVAAIEDQEARAAQMQKEKQRSALLLSAQRQQLDQLESDIRSKRYEVQQHLAKPSEANCNDEPLPAAVVRLLDPAAASDSGDQDDAINAASGDDTRLP